MKSRKGKDPGFDSAKLGIKEADFWEDEHQKSNKEVS